jgi:hypothetical protein
MMTSSTQAQKLVVNAVNLKTRKPTNNATIGNIATMTSMVVFIGLTSIRQDNQAFDGAIAQQIKRCHC